jgi:hypothetical protein
MLGSSFQNAGVELTLPPQLPTPGFVSAGAASGEVKLSAPPGCVGRIFAYASGFFGRRGLGHCAEIDAAIATMRFAAGRRLAIASQ